MAARFIRFVFLADVHHSINLYPFIRLHYAFGPLMCMYSRTLYFPYSGSIHRYEERSLGVFKAPVGDIEEGLEKLPSRERIGRYIGWHIRHQLSMGRLLSERHFSVLVLMFLSLN
jgi:hypothetical protein